MNIPKHLAIALMLAGLIAFSAVVINMTSSGPPGDAYCAGSKEADAIVRARTSTLLSQIQYEFPNIPMRLDLINPVTLTIKSDNPQDCRKIADRWDDLIRQNMINAGPCPAGVIGESQ